MTESMAREKKTDIRVKQRYTYIHKENTTTNITNQKEKTKKKRGTTTEDEKKTKNVSLGKHK